MEGGHTHEVAKRIRAARAYAGISRLALGRAVELSAEQIGRYERGAWKDGPPRRPMLDGIARACGLPIEVFDVDIARFAEIKRLPEGVAAVPDPLPPLAVPLGTPRHQDEAPSHRTA